MSALRPWNIKPCTTTKYADIQVHDGGVDSLTGFLVTFDIASALQTRDEKFSCGTKLTLPKKDGLTSEAKVFVSISSQSSLHCVRGLVRSLSLNRKVGKDKAISLTAVEGVLILTCPFSGPVFRPVGLRVLSAVFRAKSFLTDSQDFPIYIGGEILLRLDEAVDETRSFWEEKKRLHL